MRRGRAAIRLSPREPLLYVAALPLSFACLMAGQHEEAIVQARKAIDGNPRLALARFVLAAALARIGQAVEAAEAAGRLREVAPRFRAGTLRRGPGRARQARVRGALPGLRQSSTLGACRR